MPKDIPGVMREFKEGKLHSGSSKGPTVKNRKQAVAIALSEQRQLKRRKLAVGGIADTAQGGWNQRNKADPVISHGLVPDPTPGRADAHNLTVPAGAYVIPADVVSAFGEGNTASGAAALDRRFAAKAQEAGFAQGGGIPQIPMVPVMLSGGEYVVAPQIVAHLGGGDLDKGHDVMDALVKHVRDKNIKTLKKLPGPIR